MLLKPRPRNITSNYTLTPADFAPRTTQINVSAADTPITLTLPQTDRLTGARQTINITDTTNPITLESTTQNINRLNSAAGPGDSIFQERLNQAELASAEHGPTVCVLRCDPRGWFIEASSYNPGDSGFAGI